MSDPIASGKRVLAAIAWPDAEPAMFPDLSLSIVKLLGAPPPCSSEGLGAPRVERVRTDVDRGLVDLVRAPEGT